MSYSDANLPAISLCNCHTRELINHSNNAFILVIFHCFLLHLFVRNVCYRLTVNAGISIVGFIYIERGRLKAFCIRSTIEGHSGPHFFDILSYFLNILWLITHVYVTFCVAFAWPGFASSKCIPCRWHLLLLAGRGGKLTVSPLRSYILIPLIQFELKLGLYYGLLCSGWTHHSPPAGGNTEQKPTNI